MLDAALLGLIEGTAQEVVVLTVDLDEASYFASRLTRKEVQRRLASLARSVADLDPALRSRLSEIDWGSWLALGRVMAGGREDRDSEWHAIEAMLPALLMSLTLYRKSRPEAFRYSL